MVTRDRVTAMRERLAAIHRRVQWIADEEYYPIATRDAAARQAFLAEKKRLLDEAEKIIEGLEGPES